MRMLDDLAGKVAVITGAGSGIGEGLARACAAEGMHVVVADVDQARADTVAASLGGVGSALPVAVDVSDADAVDRFATLVYETFGATHLLCNNAGVCPFGRLWEFTAVDWQWIVGVNLFGVANGIRSFVPRMLAQGTGAHIVNTASGAGFIAEPRLGAYAATKHAVIAISDALRLELAPHGIGVSALCPGGVNTNIIQSGARRSAADPAAALAEDLRAFMSEIDTSWSTVIEPAQVAATVLWGIRENLPYIVTAPGAKQIVADHHGVILDAHDRAHRHDPSLP